MSHVVNTIIDEFKKDVSEGAYDQSTIMDKFKEIQEKVAELKELIEESEEDPWAEGDRRYDEQRDNELT